LTSVTVSHRQATLISDITATVECGEFVALIGRNGAGKTTLLRTISGMTAFAGDVRLTGETIRRRSRRQLARTVSLIPQSPTVPAGMCVSHYVALGRTPHLGLLGAERPADRRAVSNALQRLDIGLLASRRVETLSGGEMQRVVVARALAQEAPVMLLDEPTSALDLGRQQEVLELVDDLRRDGGLTVIAALHDLTLAGQFADRLLLIDRGRLVATGRPRDILSAATVQRYYGAQVEVIANGAAPVVVPRRRAR
jgi:iron complex transport system ATP-binding protein